jgi:hypothetical protein
VAALNATCKSASLIWGLVTSDNALSRLSARPANVAETSRFASPSVVSSHEGKAAVP